MAGLTVLDMYYQAEAEYKRSFLYRAAGQHRARRELKTARRVQRQDWGWTALATAPPEGSGGQAIGGSLTRQLHRLWNMLRDQLADRVSAARALVWRPQR